MKILFAGSNYYPSGGANDIIATNVKISALKELLEAFRDGNDWWHLYDTSAGKIVDSGIFEKKND